MNYKLQTTNPKGFTLIELLVVIAVTGILIAISVPSLISFNRRQQLKNGQSEVKSALRFAQNKALASEVECTTGLRGWYVSTSSGASNYSISGRCKIPQAIDFDTRIFQLPPNLTFGNFSPSPIYTLFSPLTQPVTFYSSLANLDVPNDVAKLIITQVLLPVVNQSGETAQVVITSAGEIK